MVETFQNHHNQETHQPCSIVGPQGDYYKSGLPQYDESGQERKGFHNGGIISAKDGLFTILCRFRDMIPTDIACKRWGMRFVCDRTVLKNAAQNDEIKELMQSYFEGALDLTGAEHVDSYVNNSAIVYLGNTDRNRYPFEKEHDDFEKMRSAKKVYQEKKSSGYGTLPPLPEEYNMELYEQEQKLNRKSGLEKVLRQYGASEEEIAFMIRNHNVAFHVAIHNGSICAFVAMERAQIKLNGIREPLRIAEISGAWTDPAYRDNISSNGQKPQLNKRLTQQWYKAYARMPLPDAPHLVYGESHVGQAVVVSALLAGRSAMTEVIAGAYNIERPCVLRGDYIIRDTADSYIPTGMTREIYNKIYATKPT